MKIFAILSVLVLLLTLVGVGSLYMTANIYVDACGVVTAEAATQPELFNVLADQVRLGAVVGTPFSNTVSLSAPEDYQFCIYTVRLKNNCRIPAEMVELQISPMAGDVLQIGSAMQLNDSLQIGTAPAITVQPGSTADATAVLLTSANMHAIREVTVTYYMWGIPFTLKTTVK